MHANTLGERCDRLHAIAYRANSLVTLLVAWYSVEEEDRGSVLGEYHLLGVLELLQQTTQQLACEVLRQG